MNQNPHRIADANMGAPIFAYQGAQNVYVPVKYANYHVCHCFKSNTFFTLSSPSDAVYLEAILIPTSVSLSSISSLEIQVNGQIFWDIPFSLILLYSHVKIKDNFYHITLNNTIFGDLRAVRQKDFAEGTPYADIAGMWDAVPNMFVSKDKFEIPLSQFMMCNIRLNTEDVFDVNLFVGNISYPLKYIDKINEGTDIIANQYQSEDIDNNWIRLNFNLPSVGIYVELDDKLLSYTLTLDDINCYEHDEFIINQLYQVRKRKLWSDRHRLVLQYTFKSILPLEIISRIDSYCQEFEYSYLYFFPFGTSDDANSTLNFSKINTIDLHLKTENDRYNGKAYNKRKNVLRILNYLMGFAYSV